MTAAGVLVPVLTAIVSFLSFFAIPLLALSLIRSVGSGGAK